MSEAGESSDLIHQFLVAAGQDQIKEYQEAEDTRLIQALKGLPAEDVVSVVKVVFGLDPDEDEFFSRMKDLGWNFRQDPDPSSPGQYRSGENAFPTPTKLVSFPGGSFDATPEDFARVINHEHTLKQLFGVPTETVEKSKK